MRDENCCRHMHDIHHILLLHSKLQYIVTAAASTSTLAISSMIRRIDVTSLSLFVLLMGLSVVVAEGFSSALAHRRQPFTIDASAASTTSSTSRTSLSFYPSNAAADDDVTSIIPRGGGVRYAEPTDEDSDRKGLIGKSLSAFGSIWGSLGVVYILGKAIKRVMPIALEPFQAGSTLILSPLQWRYVS